MMSVVALWNFTSGAIACEVLGAAGLGLRLDAAMQITIDLGRGHARELGQLGAHGIAAALPRAPNSIE